MISIMCLRIMGLILLIGCVFLFIKNENTYENRTITLCAIAHYISSQHENKNYNYQVTYKDMEPYSKTLFRLWDWSYKRILPRRKFKIIEPFIKGYDESRTDIKNGRL